MDGLRQAVAAAGSAEEFNLNLAAESTTVRSRWFGLLVGYLLVNLLSTPHPAILNGILLLGAIYAVVDTYWSFRGQVFLSRAPILISLMEAVFIGLLCYFDTGADSPFRFYYFLSLIVVAIRYSRITTVVTLALHCLSFTALVFSGPDWRQNEWGRLLLMPVMMGWVTWAATAFSVQQKVASLRLTRLNERLQDNQAVLEVRIDERTRELQQSQAILVQHEKQAAFGLLAAGIAHEVGNPLAAISSLVQLLQRREIDDHTRERLQMVDDQLRRIQRTLRELVDFSRPTNTEKSLTSLEEAISVALNIAKYYKRRKGKNIVTEFAPGLPSIWVVRDQLVQIVLNLVLNAMDATEEGGTVGIRCEQDGDDVLIHVRDDGAGIAEAARKQIFQPYFTTKPTGTGLGLFVCKIVAEHSLGGGISLSESTAEGTEFTVRLPIAGGVTAEPSTLSAATSNVAVAPTIGPTTIS